MPDYLREADNRLDTALARLADDEAHLSVRLLIADARALIERAREAAAVRGALAALADEVRHDQRA